MFIIYLNLHFILYKLDKLEQKMKLKLDQIQTYVNDRDTVSSFKKMLLLGDIKIVRDH